MAEQKLDQPKCVYTRLMNKEDKGVVASKLKEVVGSTLGLPFAGMWKIDSDKSSNKLKAYMVKKVGEDKALEKAKSAGFKSIEEATEFHFNEVIAFLPGPPVTVMTTYVGSDNKSRFIMAPEGEISKDPQPGPLQTPIYTQAMVTSMETVDVLLVVYFKDAEGKDMIGSDQRTIVKDKPDVMTEVFMFDGEPTSTKVFNRVNTF